MIQNIIGGELGSNKAVLSRLQRSKLETITSEASNLEIPIMVGFAENERSFSDQCLVKLKRNYQKSVIQLINLFGEYDQTETNFQFSVCENKDNEYFFPELQLKSLENSENSQKGLNSQQVLAGYVGYLENLIRKKNNINFISVFSVPSYFNAAQKKQVQQAFSIAKFPLAKVIDENVAIASAYMISKKQDLAEIEEKPVLFIDVGYSKTNIFYANFQKQKSQILYRKCLQNLGIRTIDKILINKVIELFTEKLKKNGEEYPHKNKKIQIRIQEAVEKTRKVLSSISDATIEIECLYQEEDFSYNLTRQEFESLIQTEFISILKQELQKTAKFLQNKKLPFEDLEILGGGVRIPIVKDLIQSTFKVNKLGVSMQVESISRGCTIQCAQYASMFNPLLKVEQYQVTNCSDNEHNINILINNESVFSLPVKQFQQLPYSSQQLIDLSKYYEQNNQKDLEIVLQLEKEKEILSTIKLTKNSKNTHRIQENQQNQDQKMEIEQEQQEQTEKKEQEQEQEQTKMEEEPEEEFEVENQQNRQFQLHLGFSLSEDQQLDLRQAYETFSYQNSKNQTISYKTAYDHKCHWKGEIPEEQLKALQTLESKQKEVDMEIVNLNNLRNSFEKQIYDYERKIKEELQLILSPDQIQQLTKVTATFRKWFEENGYEVQKSSIFESKLSELNSEFEPFLQSLEFNNTMSVEVKTAKDLKNYQEKTIDGLVLNLRNQNLGDGSGFFGFFKKGACKIAEILSKVKIYKKLNLDLGNAALSDEGVIEILQSCEKQENLKEFGLDLESNPESATRNSITVECLKPLYRLIQAQSNSLEIFSLCMNKIYDEEFDKIARILYLAPKLKAVSIQVKKGKLSENIRKEFKEKMQNLTKLELVYYNENNEKEGF